MQYLKGLVADGVIDSVVCPLKSGKEADLFVVEREPYHYVAKVYRERKFRNFRNDAGYREGRAVRNTRTQRALAKGSKFGAKKAEEAWHTSEADALTRLAAAGARVPRILEHYDRILIMELICDEEGNLAPQLAQVNLNAEQAWEMYEKIMAQVVLMLMSDLVHGDLSPYNILVRAGDPVIIDMPQAVSAAHNQQAGKLLERDVHAVTRHLGLIDPEIRKRGRDSWQLWREYEGGTLTEDFRPEAGAKRPTTLGDVEELVSFVRSAQEEAELEQLAKDGDADAQKLLRAADRRAAKLARKQEAYQAELAAAEAAKNQPKPKPVPAGQGKKSRRRSRKGGGKPDNARGGNKPTDQARPKRSARGKKGPAPAAGGSPAVPSFGSGTQAESKPRRRRSRRRRGKRSSSSGSE